MPLIPWRIQRLSQEFSASLQYHRDRGKFELRGNNVNLPDHQRNQSLIHLIGEEAELAPHCLFPRHDKTRFELALVLPKIDGDCNDRQRDGQISPPARRSSGVPSARLSSQMDMNKWRCASDIRGESTSALTSLTSMMIWVQPRLVSGNLATNGRGRS